MNEALVACLDTSAPLLSFQLQDIATPGGTVELPPHRKNQEKLIYDDMIRAIASGRANHFRRYYNHETRRYSFHATSTIETTLNDVIEPLLVLASAHLLVSDYAGSLSDLDSGRVNQALGAQLTNLCRELIRTCCEVESQASREPMSLQDLVLAMGTMVRKFEHATALVLELREANTRGGGILYLLSRRLETIRGSSLARDLFSSLIDAASQPFLEMLTKWIYHGTIDDPFNEFMVQLRPNSLPLSQDWDKYYIKDSLVPLELSSSDLYNQVLLAGKYLEVISEYQQESEVINHLEAPTSLLDKSLLIVVSEAYKLSNEKLLQLLWSLNLEERLIEFKHTFFLDNSDFLPTFLETVERDLNKPVHKVSIEKLQYALEIAIQQPGSISSEQHLDDLRVSLASTGLIDELLGIASVSGVTVAQLEEMGDDALTQSAPVPEKPTLNTLQALQLDFEIPFPQNLVISRSAVLRYQFLFRLFLTLRTTIHSLGDVWTIVAKAPCWRRRSQIPEVEAFKRKSSELLNRILKLFQALMYYCTINVIEANWRHFSSEMHNCKTVDNLQQHHLAFLDKCLKECLLTRPNLLRCQSKLFKTGRMYATFLKNHESTLAIIDPELGECDVDEFGDITPEDMMEFMDKTLAQYSRASDKYIQSFIDELSAATVYENAVLRSLLGWLETEY